MSVAQVVASLKRMQELDNETNDVDIELFERQFREILNELSIKKIQVDQLRKELDEANLQIHDLKRNLDSSKTTIREKEFNFEIALQNNKNLGEKLQNYLNFTTKTKMQYESAISENKQLRELVQQLELEKCDLTRKLKHLEMQHENDISYQNDLINKNCKIESKIQELIRNFEEIERNQTGLKSISETIIMCEDLQNKTEYYEKELKSCKESNFELEKQYVCAKATADKLSHFIKESSFCLNYEDTKIILDEWKKSENSLRNEIKQAHDIIANLTEKLKSTEEKNKKFCKWQTELEEQNRNLKDKLQTFLRKTHENISTQTDDFQEKEI
ncbi:rho-associated protein kinase 2 [Agrilus planipennis]|uniref:Rho-associated protein kinase 2 n=1 Tax=Agrilus planipennis TaxID=224129 RepID=A0A1W4WZG8_AGRPL|nr:rho-associated protein kinase 2 [Agrilus planipennis]